MKASPPALSLERELKNNSTDMPSICLLTSSNSL